MPLITLTVRKPKTVAFKSAVLEGVHRALVASGVPQADRFHRVLELDASDFRAGELRDRGERVLLGSPRVRDGHPDHPGGDPVVLLLQETSVEET